jgi:ATP-dependent Clp protease ATP-binding subunit ClpC
VDEIIVFRPLSREQIKSIVDILMERIRREIRGQGMALAMTDAARDLLAREGYDPQYGARPLRRAIQRLVEDPLSDDMLRGKFSHGDEITMDSRDGQVVFEKKREPVSADKGS